jgi:hypothetical protein
LNFKDKAIGGVNFLCSFAGDFLAVAILRLYYQFFADFVSFEVKLFYHKGKKDNKRQGLEDCSFA